jgi:hypothetical protein
MIETEGAGKAGVREASGEGTVESDSGLEATDVPGVAIELEGGTEAAQPVSPRPIRIVNK